MKRLLFKTLLLLFIPIAVSSFYMLLKKDAHSVYASESHVADSYRRMEELGDTAKIVIIAGSNGSFGFTSQMLADSFNMPVVNTCTHAGIGIRMQFEMFKDQLHKNDIVVFCPEYYEGTKRLYGESTLLRILSTHMPSAYLKISTKQWIYLFKYIGIHYLECRSHKEKYAHEFDGVYSRKSVNEYGDICCERPPLEDKVMYTFRGTMDDDTKAYYKQIISFCKEKHIRLIHLPPTLMETNYREQEAQIDSLSKFMKDNGFAYQTPTIRYMFPDSLYHNTSYHMTQSGATIRTQRAIEDIKRILNKR